VETHGLEHGVIGAVAFPGNDSGSSHQAGRQVIDDVPVQVGHHQHVELVRVLDQLRGERRAR